jgi:hypothetical protein
MLFAVCRRKKAMIITESYAATGTAAIGIGLEETAPLCRRASLLMLTLTLMLMLATAAAAAEEKEEEEEEEEVGGAEGPQRTAVLPLPLPRVRTLAPVSCRVLPQQLLWQCK